MKKLIYKTLVCIAGAGFLFCQALQADPGDKPPMYFGDTSRIGEPFSKDPHVIFFQNHYLMYYSVPPFKNAETNLIKGWGIGIAMSTNLVNWEPVSQIIPSQECDAKGLCAPCARVINDQVHLFYQAYGGGKTDAICHAVSNNGLTFTKNQTNPIFHPEEGTWSCGRAIDAEVFRLGDEYLLYYATRDMDFKKQLIGVAKTKFVEGDKDNFNRDRWTNISTNKAILAPELPWEGECIEAPSIISRNDKLYMFYAGAYNNWPQQIGVAESTDGINWKRLSDKPFLANGAEGEWNSSESGHPHIFDAPDGRTFLFYQGNDNKGKNRYLSNVEVIWDENGPKLKESPAADPK